MSKKEESKTFNLKVSETNLLIYIRNHQQAIFSGLLSTIAMDRLSYPVTDRTKFELNAELSEVTISELPEEKKTDDSGVKAAKQ